MKKIIKENLMNSYENCLYEMDNDPNIFYRDFVTPKSSDQKCFILKKNGIASHYYHLSTIEKEVYHVVEDAIKHRTPLDSNLEKYSFEVSSVHKLYNHMVALRNGKKYIPIIFEGKKGSGKTTSLNLFTKRCNYSFESNKILVIRGNAEEYQKLKVQNIHIDPKEANIKLSIADYMLLRMSLLLVKHINEPHFKEIFQAIRNIECPVMNNPYVRKHGKKGVVNDLIEYISKQLDIVKHDGHGSASGFEIHKMLRKPLSLMAKDRDSPKGIYDWVELGVQIIRYCENNNIRIINIFDGIDNIYSFTNITKKAYESMISDISDLFSEATGKNVFVHYVVACRPETRASIRAYINDGRPNCPIDLIHHDSKQTNDISNKKMDLVIEALNKIKLEPKFKNNPKASLLITNFLNTKEYSELIEKLKSDVDGINHGMEIFSYNVRSFLYNYITFVLTKTSYEKVRQNSPSYIKYGGSSHQTIYSLFLKNLFSGGRSLIETDEMLSHGQAKYAVVLPNPFSYPSNTPDNKLNIKDHILATIRILKAFDNNREVKPMPNIIIEYITKKFDYEESIISELFERLVQFRMIEREEGQDKDKEALYRTTNAKKALFHILFNHPEIITWLSFDSTLCKKTWETISSNIKYKNYDMEKYYISMVTIIGIRFVAYLNYVSEMESNEVICDFANCSDSLSKLIDTSIANEAMTRDQFKELLELVNSE